ncbi:hypothetical protein ACFL34_02860, partial [Candidatus Sumerlaeota bacterium]
MHPTVGNDHEPANPPPPAPTARARAAELARKLDSAFDEPIERVRVSPLYSLGLIVVSIVMALLPLIYLALIGATAWVLYSHATSSFGLLLSSSDERLSRLLLLLTSVTPLLAGAVLLLMMIKPLFAKRPIVFESIEVTPDEEPLLFDYVAQICEAVHAPMPARIEVDC